MLGSIGTNHDNVGDGQLGRGFRLHNLQVNFAGSVCDQLRAYILLRLRHPAPAAQKQLPKLLGIPQQRSRLSQLPAGQGSPQPPAGISRNARTSFCAFSRPVILVKLRVRAVYPPALAYVQVSKQIAAAEKLQSLSQLDQVAISGTQRSGNSLVLSYVAAAACRPLTTFY